MISLIGYELKKIFSNKYFLVFLLAILLLPSFIVPAWEKFNHRYEVLDDSGKNIKSYQLKKIVDDITVTYKGNLLEEEKIKQIKKELADISFLQTVDIEKVKAIYGKELSQTELFENKEQIESCCLYEENSVFLNTWAPVTYSLLYELNNLYSRFEKENYENYYETMGVTEYREELQEDLNKKMETVDTLIIDKIEGFTMLFKVFETTSFLLMFFFLLVSPAIFNQEDKHKTIALLKTTKVGKRKIAIAKMISILLLAIFLPLGSTLFSTFIISACYGFGNWNMSSMWLNRYVNYLFYDMFEYYLWNIGLITMGCIAISALGAFLSSMIKNSYFSLGIMMLLFLVTNMLGNSTGNIDWKMLIPPRSMGGENLMSYTNPSYLFSSVVRPEQLTLLFWSIVAPLLFLFAYIGYKRRQVTND